MAMLILDESLEIFHLVAFIIIMIGVYAITNTKPPK